MTVEISPTELDIDPVLIAGSTIENVLDICDKRWPGDIPLRSRLFLCFTRRTSKELTLYEENSKISAQDEFIL